ncbi:glycosyltransferase [Candidatus Hecatella orcuttiae]|jgi:glucosyl-3-phosphoglycerate synthase|uniref:glycosyltransferase n=1 Tax=Candidatus Hecatella orcuttiae TaxID=1935119 RepID=UPI002867CE78|nr:glycosyltransferase [Candidatus Hecatella orcuttiae]
MSEAAYSKTVQPKVTVIFTARNEEATIGKCVEAVKKSKYKPAVLVVDGYSTDNTIQAAKKAGAKVVLQERRVYPGKGVAMKTGIKTALKDGADIIVFLDADIENLDSSWLDKLVDTLLVERYDMVRGAYFRALRDAPVTKLVAKRLIHIFFPELEHYEQPLTGEVAAKAEVWRKVLEQDLPDGWGIDIAILLECAMHGFSIREVHLGFKEHRSYRQYCEDVSKLGKMSEQVAVTILLAARKYNRIDNLDEIHP